MSTQADASELYTVAEVATMMRVSKMTVYRLVQSGAMGCIRIGHSYRVPREAVRKYLAATSPQVEYSI